MSPLVAVVMGSSSDWETMKHAVEVLDRLGVAHERHIVSAHRTPVWMAEFASGAEARGLEVIIAGAGGAAHLPGMVAAHTTLPVLGVPIEKAPFHQPVRAARVANYETAPLPVTEVMVEVPVPFAGTVSPIRMPSPAVSRQ